MKKIAAALTALTALWVVTVAGAGNGIDLFSHTLMKSEFSSVEMDTTLDGKILRVTREQVPIAACRDVDDNDGDNRVDWPSDPGCTNPNDTDEWNPAPPPPVPPPPPPTEWQWMLMDATPPDYLGGGGDECMLPMIPCALQDLKVIRCKVYSFVLKPHEGHFGIDFGPAFKYEGRWRICYKPFGGGITEVSYRTGDATNTYNLWEWRGNDDGYPFHIREAHRVFVHYGGGAAICVGGGYGCGPERHFRLYFTFTDTGRYGTITKVEHYL